jgi:hypothetical protein
MLRKEYKDFYVRQNTETDQNRTERKCPPAFHRQNNSPENMGGLLHRGSMNFFIKRKAPTGKNLR